MFNTITIHTYKQRVFREKKAMHIIGFYSKKVTAVKVIRIFIYRDFQTARNDIERLIILFMIVSPTENAFFACNDVDLLIAFVNQLSNGASFIRKLKISF